MNIRNILKDASLKEIFRKIKKRVNNFLSNDIDVINFDEVDITPTLKCNLNCAMCHQHGIKNRQNMQLGGFKQLLINLKKGGVTKVSLVGGEIFAMPQIWQFIEEIEKIKLRYDLATNATLLKQEDIEKIKKLKFLEKISTSLDGTEKIHNKIRRNPEAYKNTTKNIHQLMKVGIKVNVGCVFQKTNFNEIEEIIEGFCKQGLKDLSFLYEARTSEKEKEQTRNIIKKLTNKESEILMSSFKNPLGELSEDEKREIPRKVRNITNILKKYDITLGFPLQMRDTSVLNKKKPLKNYTCSIFRGYNFTVYTDYNLSFCPFIVLNGNFNASKADPKRIVNYQDYKAIRKFFKKHGALPICRFCCALRKK